MAGGGGRAGYGPTLLDVAVPKGTGEAYSTRSMFQQPPCGLPDVWKGSRDDNRLQIIHLEHV